MAPSSPEESKHSTIANHLRRAIESNKYPVGSEMPSESVLVEEFNVARGTIRQAMATLKMEGLIQTSRGKRPIVQARPLAHSIDDFFSFSSWVRAQGRTPGQVTLEVSRRRRSASDKDAVFGYPRSEHLIHVVRLRLIDDRPTMIERSVFDDSLGRLLLDFDTDSGSIFEHLVQNGADLDEGTHFVDATQANQLDSELLEVDANSPILRVRRITKSRFGKILEYSEDRYRPDQATIRIHNSRASAASLASASRTTADMGDLPSVDH